MSVKIDGHYDAEADVAWLRFEGYDPATVVAEEAEFGLRELGPANRHLVGLEYWRASEQLPAEFLRMLPAATVERRRVTPDVASAVVVCHGVLRLVFADGVRGEVGVLDRMRGPVFEQARTPEGFAQVTVDAETGTVFVASRFNWS